MEIVVCKSLCFKEYVINQSPKYEIIQPIKFKISYYDLSYFEGEYYSAVFIKMEDVDINGEYRTDGLMREKRYARASYTSTNSPIQLRIESLIKYFFPFTRVHNVVLFDYPTLKTFLTDQFKS